jgi:membrane associated rhomboid family serine protease
VDVGRNDQFELALLTNRAVAEEWALVLSAIDISTHIEQRAGSWALSVAAADAGRAAATLAEYTNERRPRPVPIEPSAPVHPGSTSTGIVVALLLLAFHAVAVSSPHGSAWRSAGSAMATRILGGEWWRAITALTLHADWSHVANNTVSMAIFGTALFRWFGPGVGLWLILLAGAGGNAVNAFLRGHGHVAIGASTAVFAAVGALATLQLPRRLAVQAKGLARMRVWAPVAAGMALLAFLGSSANSDVGAHFFGFICGAALGFAASRLHAERIEGWPQAALLGVAAVAICGCWWMAL